MKIVFMGTPDFAVPCLRTLAESAHEVAAVFTQPDKPKGRGYKLIPTPVKAAAAEYDIPVYQPLSLRKGEDAEESMRVLREIAPDLIVVTAYGQILPKEILELPKYGCINIHASLLPKYRGAAPINWVLLNGEKETGVTSMQMSEGLDTGDMLIKRATPIGENETCEELYARLSAMGGEVLAETIDALEKGSLSPEVQDDSLSCYSPMIRKEMSALDFSKTAAEVHNTIRGVTGFTMLEGKRLKVFASRIAEGSFDSAENGSVVDTKRFAVKCGDGRAVIFTEVQPEGKKRMKTEDFLRGRKLTEGELLG
ncbi:methionyl-tRNA formyltransferase [Ruminococcus flavefaciens]|uniref:Methionyl-tRNA formyltransferase n=1 Tax=Ruminococcus flavefaciens TaxID=1265 RepID=A0A315XZ96_RUMFL|nr:methionyl-tRNA formyltransferase [Ruminococcus flavefaciens]MBQ6169114.1 methionyl-tRNA formyltransferase [Ruminococcus sp.]PWJ12634.1 methionyl-tRNA formyltransferase [Ruminococcus flavefaciens]SSA49116.1 methionyl-tRNA formyltransferase [Ruminococcus flavefaciens]